MSLSRPIRTELWTSLSRKQVPLPNWESPWGLNKGQFSKTKAGRGGTTEDATDPEPVKPEGDNQVEKGLLYRRDINSPSQAYRDRKGQSRGIHTPASPPSCPLVSTKAPHGLNRCRRARSPGRWSTEPSTLLAESREGRWRADLAGQGELSSTECVPFNIYVPWAQNNPHLRFTSLVPRKILDSRGEIVGIFQPYCQALEIKT